MCIRDSLIPVALGHEQEEVIEVHWVPLNQAMEWCRDGTISVSYTHLRAHETVLDLVCRLLLENKTTTSTLTTTARTTTN